MKKTLFTIILASIAFFSAQSSYGYYESLTFRGQAIYLDEFVGDEEGWGGTGEIGFVMQENNNFQHILGFETGYITGDANEGSISLEADLFPLLFNYTLSSKPSSNSGFFYQIGGGIGALILDFELTNTFSRTSDSDVVFGGQVFTRLGYQLNENFDATAGFRYFLSDDAEFNGLDAGDLNTIGFDLGITYTF